MDRILFNNNALKEIIGLNYPPCASLNLGSQALIDGQSHSLKLTDKIVEVKKINNNVLFHFVAGKLTQYHVILCIVTFEPPCIYKSLLHNLLQNAFASIKNQKTISTIIMFIVIDKVT